MKTEDTKKEETLFSSGTAKPLKLDALAKYNQEEIKIEKQYEN